MSAWVCALMEKGTSWTRDARFVAVTMIAPCSSTGTGCGFVCGWTACVCCSGVVCAAAAGEATAMIDVPISNVVAARMSSPLFFVPGRLMPETIVTAEEQGGFAATFSRQLLQDCYRQKWRQSGEGQQLPRRDDRDRSIAVREKAVLDDFRLLLD